MTVSRMDIQSQIINDDNIAAPLPTGNYYIAGTNYRHLEFKILTAIEPDDCHDIVKTVYTEAKDEIYPLNKIAILKEKMGYRADLVRFVLGVDFQLRVAREGECDAITPAHGQMTGNNFWSLNSGNFSLCEGIEKAIITEISNKSGGFHSPFYKVQLTVIVLVNAYESQDKNKPYLDFTNVVTFRDEAAFSAYTYTITKENLLKLGKTLLMQYSGNILFPKNVVDYAKNYIKAINFTEISYKDKYFNNNLDTNNNTPSKSYKNDILNDISPARHQQNVTVPESPQVYKYSTYNRTESFTNSQYRGLGSPVKKSKTATAVKARKQNNLSSLIALLPSEKNEELLDGKSENSSYSSTKTLDDVIPLLSFGDEPINNSQDKISFNIFDEEFGKLDSPKSSNNSQSIIGQLTSSPAKRKIISQNSYNNNVEQFTLPIPKPRTLLPPSTPNSKSNARAIAVLARQKQMNFFSKNAQSNNNSSNTNAPLQNITNPINSGLK